MKSTIAHHFTVDVEEYFQVSAFDSAVSRSSWSDRESRVVASVHRLLELLAERDATGTFFVLGWVAERHPGMVREIAEAGHEIASHGWGHRRVIHLTPQEFRESVRRSKQVLESIAGEAVAGYRAPSFSIVPGREWALDILLEEGYCYDSSLFPVRRPGGYGFPDGGRDPYWLPRPQGRLAEVPPTTLRLGGVNFPAAGGAYFRLFPYQLVQAAFRQAERRGEPGTFYIHPWELDTEQPRIRVPWTSGVRHYTGLQRTIPRLRRLLSEFRFQPIARTLHLISDTCLA